MGRARSRFLDFIDGEQVAKNSPITIFGAGGIGSRIGQTLAEVGFNLSLWDDDIVKKENIGSGRFSFLDVDKPKVTALKERFETGLHVSVEAHNERFKGQKKLSGIVICGVDSKEIRAQIWKSIKRNSRVPLYLDGRVGGERFKLFALNPCDAQAISKYETQLDLSNPSKVAPCTAKFAPQAGMALDFYMWTAIKEFIVDNRYPFQVAGCNFDVRMHY